MASERGGDEERGGERGPRATASNDSVPPASAPWVAELTVGTIVDGKYRIESFLGRGGMGVVVAAVHIHLKERVALKFLAVPEGSSEELESRFRREAQLTARLRGEHVCRVVDVGAWEGRAMFMVMEYLAGMDLRSLLKQCRMLPTEQAISYIIQVCEGLAEAHGQGIVHRDIKPSNLFLTKRPDGSDLVKILDFGISKWLTAGETDHQLTKTGVVLGSPKYVAPEQLFGAREADARSDIWSIGAILYEMLAGHAPFDFPSVAQICVELASNNMPRSITARRPDVPAALERVIFRCFEREPAARPASLAELASELLEAIGSPLAPLARDRIGAIETGRAPERNGASATGAQVAMTLAVAQSLAGAPSLGSSAVRMGSGSVPAGPPRSASHPSVPVMAPKRGGRELVLLGGMLAAGVAVAAFVLRGRGLDADVAKPAAAAAPTAIVDAAPLVSSAPEVPHLEAPHPAPTAQSRAVVRHGGAAPRPTRPAPVGRTAEPAPAPAEPPPAAPAPTNELPKKQYNPLEDRQ